MRRTRTLVALVLSAMLALSAAACGDDTEDDRIPFTGERPTTTTIPEDEEEAEEAEGEDGAEDGQDGGAGGESEDAPADDGDSTDAAAA